MIKRNQPAALPWPVAAVRHTAPSTGHGRHESRSTNTCGNARPEGCATGGETARAATPNTHASA
ncbi:hypothetical protein GCM10027028_32680 [Streptomyces sundarbansensis]